jgi:hemoglobin/transferrin/lactoferrin receptor protein
VKIISKVLVIIIINIQILFAQTMFVKGKVLNSNTQKPLVNVNVIIPELLLRTETNLNGNYILKNVPLGKYTIKFSRLGFKKVTKKITITDKRKNVINASLQTSPIQLGEAKVISSRTDKLVREIPIPIEFIDAVKIDKNIKLTVSDLMNNEPGITVAKDSPWGTAVNIRGLSKQNIVYLIDGNRIETSTNIAGGLSLLDMSDIQSIEIVKGGLSSLYGTGATGGVVNLISKQISSSENFYFNGAITSSYSNVNNGTGNNLLLIASDKYWALKISGSFRNADDAQTPSGKLTNSSFNDKSISASLAIFPMENMNVKIDYQKFKAWDVGIPGGAPFPKNATAKYLNADREMFSGIIKIKNLLPGMTNTSLKFYRQLINRDVELLPNATVVVKPGATHTTIGALLKAEWIINNNNYLVGGLDVWQREYNGYRTKNIKPLKKIIADKPVPDSKFKNIGFFIQDEIHLLKNELKLTLGGRYDFINITNEATNNPNYILVNGNKIIPPANPLASYKESNVNNKSFSGNIGILYSLLNNIDITLNTAYTFRSPSLEERFQFIDLGAIQYLGNPNLEPEQGTFFDLGLRVWKEKVSFKINGFLNLFNNLVVDQIKIVDSLYQKENVGRAKLLGFDASLQYNFYKNYVTYFSAAYVEGKDTEQDKYLPQIPPFNGKFGLQIPIKNIFTIDVSASTYAGQNKVAEKENTTSGYTYFDLGINSEKINLGSFNIQIFTGIENIFNKEYKNHLSTYRGINLVEPGRNIYVKIKVNF